MGGISIWQLIIIAVIVILLFGTKKLRGIGGDLGSAIKGFKKAMQEEEKKEKDKPTAEVEKKKDKALKKDQSAKPDSKQKDQD